MASCVCYVIFTQSPRVSVRTVRTMTRRMGRGSLMPNGIVVNKRAGTPDYATRLLGRGRVRTGAAGSGQTENTERSEERRFEEHLRERNEAGCGREGQGRRDGFRSGEGQAKPFSEGW